MKLIFTAATLRMQVGWIVSGEWAAAMWQRIYEAQSRLRVGAT